MRGRFRYLLLFPFTLVVSAQPAQGACVDPAQLAHSVLSITRHFANMETRQNRNLTGVQGSGWYLSPTTIVTAEHVVAAMELSTEDWKPLEIMDGDGSQLIAARIIRVAGDQAEKLAVIELQRAVAAAQIIAIREEPLVPEEPVMTLAFPAGRFHHVSGRFVQFGDGGKLTGMALLELYEGENRLAVDHGASGAPVVDCGGRVAAVVSNTFTQSLYWAQREIRISTAWGTPNVVSVPVQALRDLSKSSSSR